MHASPLLTLDALTITSLLLHIPEHTILSSPSVQNQLSLVVCLVTSHYFSKGKLLYHPFYEASLNKVIHSLSYFICT